MKNYLQEIKNSYIKIRIKTENDLKTIKLLSTLNINLYEITSTKNYLYLKINKEDLPKIKKILKVKIINYYGIPKYKHLLTQNLVLIYTITLFLVFAIFQSHLIADITVIHSNPQIREIILDELNDAGLKKMTFKKSYAQLQEIKNHIITKYKDQIEWLEIVETGMNYTIKVQDRLNTSLNEPPSACHIIATKEGMIKRIIPTTGEIIKKVNNYVRVGDIIISGNITLNEEVKNTVCASAKVYAETWYTISVTMPKTRITKNYTGNKSFNFMLETPLNKYKILRSRLTTFEDKNKLLLKVGDYKFYYQKELEYLEETQTLTDAEVLSLIEEEINQKLAVKLKDDYQILSQKVLKKTINDSTIYIEAFVTVEEQIGIQQTFTIEEKGDE